jgi:integrase
MANSIKMLFWLHRTKINKDGLVPLMVRLSYQSKRADKATGFYVNPKQWNTNKQRMKGGSEISREVNGWIEKTVVKGSSFFADAKDNNDIHLPTIMEQLFTNPKEEVKLLDFVAKFNEQLRLRVKNDIAFSTYEKYVFTEKKLKAFIQTTKENRNILLKKVSAKLIMDFDNYLRAHDNNQHNTAVKYCLNLKRILNVAVMQELIPVNPLNKYKTVYKDTQQVYLSENEVLKIKKARLTKPNHLLVRDLFIFQCYTGLAYTDVIKLEVKDIIIDPKGKKWIIKARQKTGIVSTIPLLPKSLELLEKYLNGKTKGPIFPHYSIQKYNQYIAEIGDLVGINKKLSSHVGRRTFGNIGLSKGISLNVISKILGHSNTIITQRIYAITTQNIISSEIIKWR